MPVSQFLSLFCKDGPACLGEMGTEKLLLVLLALIEMALLCQKDERVYYMTRRVFVECKLSIGYLNVSGYIRETLKTWLRKSLTAQTMLQTNAYEMHLYFPALIFLKAYLQTRLGFTVCN